MGKQNMFPRMTIAAYTPLSLEKNRSMRNCNFLLVELEYHQNISIYLPHRMKLYSCNFRELFFPGQPESQYSSLRFIQVRSGMS